MNEPNATTEPVTTGEPTATTTTATTSFIGSDGTFTEGWRDAYVPEDVRKEAVFDRVKNIQGMAKSLASAERMIGSDKIVKPNDKFGDADWDAYYQAGGWNNKPVDIKRPDEVPEELWSQDRAKTYAEGFNKLRLNPKQIAGIMDLYKNNAISELTNMRNNSDTAMAELKSSLLAEKGNAYTQFTHNGNFAIEKGTRGESLEFKERVIAKYGNDPDLVRLLGNIGGQFGESGSIPKASMMPTPSDIDSKIAEIHKSDAFMKPSHPEHKQAMANITRLYSERSNIRKPA